ncbi:MAG TPA: hypothetical protein VGE52_11445, partial [Pirellulales bacterium]
MYRLASFLAFLIVGFCVVGYFRGWLAVDTSQTGPDGKVHVNVTVDRTKLRSDVEAAKTVVKGGVDKLKQEFDDKNGSTSIPSNSSSSGFNFNQTQAPTNGYDNVR